MALAVTLDFDGLLLYDADGIDMSRVPARSHEHDARPELHAC